MKFIVTLCFHLLLVQYVSGQTTLPGLDPSFGNHGVLLDSFSNGDTKLANDILIQPDGKIIAAGNVLNRYLTSGKLDSTFGGTGSIDLSAYSQPFSFFARNVHLQNDGRIVLAGGSFNDGVAMRFKSNGQFDSSFGTNGITEAYFDDLKCSVLQSDGKLLVAGLYDYSVLIRRFKTNGQPDSSFGMNGFVLTPNGNYVGNVGGISVMSDGRIVIGGIGYNAQVDRAAMAMRYLPDGRLDTTLNHSGVVYPFVVDYCRDMLLQTDGKMLLAIGGLSGDGYIMRLKLDGSVDSMYGQEGFVTVPSMRITTMIWLPDNKVLCGGNDGDFVVARVKANGVSMDSTFGSNGVIRTDMSGFYDDIINGIALQQDRKIVAVGQSRINSGFAPIRLTVARYLPDATTSVISIDRSCVQIAPNPAADAIYISYEQSPVGATSYKICSLEGKLLRTGSFNGDHSILSVSDLAPGVYLLSLSTPHFLQAKLFTKQ